MDKGQHLRLLITDNSQKNVVALARDLTLHLSATTENSTTKDTTDGSGVVWDEFDVTQRNGDIQFSGLVGVGSDPYTPASADDPEVIGGLSFADWLNKVTDTPISWKIVFVSGAQNRVIGKELCHGHAKLSNVSANPQNGQASVTYNGTLNIYGPVVVGAD